MHIHIVISHSLTYTFFDEARSGSNVNLLVAPSSLPAPHPAREAWSHTSLLDFLCSAGGLPHPALSGPLLARSTRHLSPVRLLRI